MKVTHIPFEKTGFFSKIMLDYINQSEKLQPFYGNFPSLQGFRKQLIEKRLQVNFRSRKIVVDSLKNQYKNIECSGKTIDNILSIEKENTFTITTGHQLNLFTGPLYFLYKIISTINLCEQLSLEFPVENFVPVYWMATEDHDFEEINYFNFKGNKIQWNSIEKGAVGRFSTEGLEAVCKVFSSQLNTSKNSNELRDIFEKAYLKHTNLADATRYIANELFGDFGLVILDADAVALKQLFIPFAEEELVKQTSSKEVSKTVNKLQENYKIQVNPREINLFYLIDGLRERIIVEEGVYKINNSNLVFSRKEILEELNKYPQRFSPNVIIRPLYQEVILPNLCYIGGGGELAYWLELKDYFKTVDIPFPILLLRNSVQIVSIKQQQKLEKLTISNEELFLKQHDLIAKKVREQAIDKVDFSGQKIFLKNQFSILREVAEKTDSSFIGAVNAQEKKQLKGLNNLKKKWIRAEKRRQEEYVNQIIELQNNVLPNQSLEERQRNFSEVYETHGIDFIKLLKTNLNPLEMEFIVLEI